MEPKSSKNKAKDVETSARKTKLEQELGRLTYQLAKLRETSNALTKRSNEIGAELERLYGGK